MSDPIFFADGAQWRSWLAEHHDSATECVVGFIKTSTGRANLRWSDAVDEAICFGWIDAVRRGIDDETYSIRFTRRKPSSIWSKINVAKVERLRSAGLMTPAGEAAFAARTEAKTGVYSFERAEPAALSEAELDRFRSHSAGYAFFEAQAPSYCRAALHWVTSAKRAETRIRRLDQLIEDSSAARRLNHLTSNRRN
jgi:uncharacterized protein YdeI (YjbR/CyaY-like superfamily)